MIGTTSSETGPVLGGVRPNAVLCKTWSGLLCVLEQPRVDNSSAGPNWSNWLKTEPTLKYGIN